MEGVEGMMRNLQLSAAERKRLKIGATEKNRSVGGAGAGEGFVGEDDPC